MKKRTISVASNNAVIKDALGRGLYIVILLYVFSKQAMSLSHLLFYQQNFYPHNLLFYFSGVTTSRCNKNIFKKI